MKLPLKRQMKMQVIEKMTIVKLMTRKQIGYLYDTSPEQMEDDLCDKKKDNIENNEKKKELEFQDENYPVEKEDGVCYLFKKS